MIFPKANVYPEPLLSAEYTILDLKPDIPDALQVHINRQLHYAIAYLCTKLVRYLLNTITVEQFKNYLSTADYYAVLQFKPLKLKDIPYTNLSRTKYGSKFLPSKN